MRWVVTVTTDGRCGPTGPLLEQTLHSFAGSLGFDGAGVVIADDSCDPEFGAWLDATYTEAMVVHHAKKRGLSGAVDTAWHAARAWDAEWVLHLEDDWRRLSFLDLETLAGLCEAEDLAQVVLKRGPVNPLEQAAGGFMEAIPANYRDRGHWVESFFGFSLNPCVVPRWVLDVEWPEGGGEREFTERLREVRPDVRFGVWGSMGSPPMVEHTGHQRSAQWML